VISELIKEVMQTCNLKQTQLAEVMGASLSRVKAITSGRVKNLTREESEALINKLGIRAGWLIMGEGEMFGVDETQDEFIARQQAIKRVRTLVSAMPIQEKTRNGLAMCVTGDPEKDGPLIAQILFAEALRKHALSAVPSLAADEAELLTCYRESSPEVRAMLKAAVMAADPRGKTS